MDKGLFFYPDVYMRQMLHLAARWAARDAAPPFEVEGPLLLTATFRRQPEAKRYVVHLLNQATARAKPSTKLEEAKRYVVHLLNQGSSWGQHSIYQKLAPLPDELNKQWGFPNQSELRGTWPVREEVIPLHDIRVRCRVPGVTKATPQPGGRALPLGKGDYGVVVTVPELDLHAMVVFE